MMFTKTSFVSAPLPAQHGRTNQSASFCIRARSKMRATPRQKLRMGSSQLQTPFTPATAEDIIHDIWSKCENAKFTLWLPYFDEDAIYYDTLYPNPFIGKSEIAKHLKNMESAIPSSIAFVLDDLAAGKDRVGARWHAETPNGVQIPFSRGASMYSFIREDGKLLISEAWDFPETPLKLAGIILPLLRGVSGLLSLFDKKSQLTRDSDKR